MGKAEKVKPGLRVPAVLAGKPFPGGRRGNARKSPPQEMDSAGAAQLWGDKAESGTFPQPPAPLRERSPPGVTSQRCPSTTLLPELLSALQTQHAPASLCSTYKPKPSSQPWPRVAPAHLRGQPVPVPAPQLSPGVPAQPSAVQGGVGHGQLHLCCQGREGK